MGAIVALSMLFEWHMKLSTTALGVSVTVSALTGIAFGFLVMTLVWRRR